MPKHDIAGERTADWREGWWDGAKRAHCVNFDARPSGMRPELIVLHHISLPAGCFEGETVLDNCMGSGTTGVACKNLGRHFIGIEKDETYFKTASERIEKV